MRARKRPALPDELKTTLQHRLVHAREISNRAVEDFHIEVYLMNQAGLTFDDIAEALGTRSSTVTDWKKKGEEAHQRRQHPA